MGEIEDRHTQAGIEVELKLELDPGEVETLRRHPSLRRLGRGRSVTRTVRSVYFDTPGLALFHKGLVLRLREGTEGTIQTVKSLGVARAGLFDRPEDEVLVAGGEPEVAAIADPSLRAAVMEETTQRGAPLEAVVETEAQRTTRVLVLGESEIELALDVGEVRTRLGAEPLCELELELVRGRAADLYAVAIELQQAAVLRPGLQSKPEKGFARLVGVAPVASRARPLGVSPEASVDELIDAMFASCLEQIVLNGPVAAAGEDIEGVHQLRVGARRLRSGLALFREILPEGLVNDLREELRWLGGELGDARDLDVFLDELLDPLRAGRPDDAALKRLRDEAVAARADAYARLRQALASERHARLVLKLGACRESRAWRDQPLSPHSARMFLPARDLGRELLARRHRKVRRQGRALASKSTAELHALRIQMKKLRYAVEFHRDLFPARSVRQFLRGAEGLQDVLGHLNDVSTAETVLDRLLVRMGDEVTGDHHRAAGFVLGWSEHVLRDKMVRLVRRWRRFKKTEPFWS